MEESHKIFHRRDTGAHFAGALQPLEILPDNMQRCRDRLLELSTLKAGWLDGAGMEIDPRAMAAAEAFLTMRPFFAGAYRLYPTEDGGILFEFENHGWDFSVEFSPTGAIEMYGVEIAGSEEMELQSFEQLDEAFISVFDARIRG
jgi:hypothetical protein